MARQHEDTSQTEDTKSQILRYILEAYDIVYDFVEQFEAPKTTLALRTALIELARECQTDGRLDVRLIGR